MGRVRRKWEELKRVVGRRLEEFIRSTRVTLYTKGHPLRALIANRLAANKHFGY